MGKKCCRGKKKTKKKAPAKGGATGNVVGLFGSLKLSHKKLHEPTTEGVANRLHCRATVTFLLGCSLMVTCLEWMGNGKNISCVMVRKEDDWLVPSSVLNAYCFVMTTFTLPKHWSSKIGEEAADMGVGDFNPHKDEVRHKAYYQWVPFVLFLQGLMFYAPHLIFKIWEGGKIKNIIGGLHRLILDKDERADKEKVLASYVADNLNSHNSWAIKMLLVEFLNLVNLVANIYFVDVFLGGEFSTYGLKILDFLEADPENRLDPMALVFPRVTKCTFFKYGPSGTIQTHDAICVLPINIINEKIYVFLWFWFWFLLAATVISLLFHIFAMITPSITQMFLRYRTMNQSGLRLEEIAGEMQLGDWKLLYLLAKNMEPVVLGEFLRELNLALEARRTVAATTDADDESAVPDGEEVCCSCSNDGLPLEV